MASLLTRLDRLPPIVCRCLARRNGRALTGSELALISGLGEQWINRLSKRKTWAAIKIEVADRFMAACGVDPFKMKRPLAYLRRQQRNQRILRHTWQNDSYFTKLLKAAE